MRLALGALVAACASGALMFAGCASDEVTGVVPDDAAPEAAPDLDTSVPDTYVPEDAAKDAAADHAPPVSFCGMLSASANPPRFCDDFDDQDVGNAWDTVNPVAGVSTIALDSAQFVSAPGSALFTVKALADGAGAVANLRSTLLAAVTHPILQFQGRYSQTTFTGGSVVIATLNVALDHLFSLYLYDPDAPTPGPALYEEVPGTPTTKLHHVITGPLPAASTWANWKIELDFTTGLANVSVDATPVLTNEPIQKVVGTEATIRVGAVYMTGPLPAFTANVDNVVLDY